MAMRLPLALVLLTACTSPPPPSVSTTTYFGRIFDGTETLEGAVEVDVDGTISAVHHGVPDTVEGTRVICASVATETGVEVGGCR